MSAPMKAPFCEFCGEVGHDYLRCPAADAVAFAFAALEVFELEDMWNLPARSPR